MPKHPSSKLPSAAAVTQEVGSGVSELYQRYSCDYCQEDIPGLRIKCADCHDFDLCLGCFSSGTQMGKHKNTHKYVFMNNGGFSIFEERSAEDDERDEVLGRGASRNKRLGTSGSNGSGGGGNSNGGACSDECSDEWNAREEMRLLDAVEQFGYGNWKDISGFIETKTAEQAKEEYCKHYIHGLVGKHTWNEKLRGFAFDHTQPADKGPLSPTLTGKLPPINVTAQEALLLAYMPHRDDFEEFDRETENLVAQIADKSVEDEDVDVALKLAQCDIYERRLREQVRRKRVARDYQLVAKFYRENPIVQIGGNNKISPTKISNQVKAAMKGEGPRQELMDSMRPLTQFYTAQEFGQFVGNLCVEKELKVRVKELYKYRSAGVTKIEDLIPFEKQRFKEEQRLKRLAKVKPGKVPAPSAKFLPTHGDYSLRALINPEAADKEETVTVRGGPFGGPGGRRKKKRSKWSQKKIKTGRRLLLQQGCILTLASPRRESTDSAS